MFIQDFDVVTCHFSDDVMSSLLSKSIEPHTYPHLEGGHGPGSTEGKFIKWQTFTDEQGSVIEDVNRIANHPLISKSIKIFGFIFDVRTGRLNAVPGAERK